MSSTSSKWSTSKRSRRACAWRNRRGDIRWGVSPFIDGGETRNFIDVARVARQGIQTEEFEGFTLAVASNNSMEYTHWIPKLNVNISMW